MKQLLKPLHLEFFSFQVRASVVMTALKVRSEVSEDVLMDTLAEFRVSHRSWLAAVSLVSVAHLPPSLPLCALAPPAVRCHVRGCKGDKRSVKDEVPLRTAGKRACRHLPWAPSRAAGPKGILSQAFRKSLVKVLREKDLVTSAFPPAAARNGRHRESQSSKSTKPKHRSAKREPEWPPRAVKRYLHSKSVKLVLKLVLEVGS